MNKIILIIATAAVTIIPRTIPYFVSGLDKLPYFIRKCMMMLPVAALGALIFPMSLLDFSSQWYAGLLGVSSAFIVSRFKAPMIVAIIVALAVTAAALAFF